jgi:glutamate-5-semialdehyde dehydrogenase
MGTEETSVRAIAGRARRASSLVARSTAEARNAACLAMRDLLARHRDELIAANQSDMQAAREAGIEGSLLERLAFGDAKIDARINALDTIASLPDPIGRMDRVARADNGLLTGRVRVPLGVILMIYEARPHVTVNAGALALKAGNAIICKGGSEAARCNALLGRMWSEATTSAGLPEAAAQIVTLTHEEVDGLLQLTEEIDLVIPRGGPNLIRSVSERSRIPVIKHTAGVCHVYVDGLADTSKALPIVLDSKLLMPAVCNAVETVLVDTELQSWLPFLVAALRDNDVEVRGCPVVCEAAPGVIPATEEDWSAEYLDTVCAVRVVDGVDGAINHINTYGSGHTDAIVTENYSHAQRFLRDVDSSVVLVNASTMFCDGATLGMGAEIGISTDKLHARGPMGLEELTTYKFVIQGDGQVMGDVSADQGEPL